MGLGANYENAVLARVERNTKTRPGDGRPYMLCKVPLVFAEIATRPDWGPGEGLYWPLASSCIGFDQADDLQRHTEQERGKAPSCMLLDEDEARGAYEMAFAYFQNTRYLAGCASIMDKPSYQSLYQTAYQWLHEMRGNWDGMRGALGMPPVQSAVVRAVEAEVLKDLAEGQDCARVTIPYPVAETAVWKVHEARYWDTIAQRHAERSDDPAVTAKPEGPLVSLTQVELHHLHRMCHEEINGLRSTGAKGSKYQRWRSWDPAVWDTIGPDEMRRGWVRLDNTVLPLLKDPKRRLTEDEIDDLARPRAFMPLWKLARVTEPQAQSDFKRTRSDRTVVQVELPMRFDDPTLTECGEPVLKSGFMPFAVPYYFVENSLAIRDFLIRKDAETGMFRGTARIAGDRFAVPAFEAFRRLGHYESPYTRRMNSWHRPMRGSYRRAPRASVSYQSNRPAPIDWPNDELQALHDVATAFCTLWPNESIHDLNGLDPKIARKTLREQQDSFHTLLMLLNRFWGTHYQDVDPSFNVVGKELR